MLGGGSFSLDPASSTTTLSAGDDSAGTSSSGSQVLAASTSSTTRPTNGHDREALVGSIKNLQDKVCMPQAAIVLCCAGF